MSRWLQMEAIRSSETSVHTRSTHLRSATSQKMAFFIVTAVKTSNLTFQTVNILLQIKGTLKLSNIAYTSALYCRVFLCT
jgi:hypothetical protein